MKRILVVDDEEDMLWMLQKNLNKGMKDVEILTAGSGEDALKILEEKKAELVITDINMPGMNGLDLLLEITNLYPQTGVMIMTAYPSNAHEKEAMMSGSLRFIEKPFDINEMRSIVEDHFKDDEGFQGTLDGIELMDLIQLIGMSRSTSALKVTTPKQEGIIYFRDGQIVHAICDELTGEEAFLTIVNYHGGTLQNIRGAKSPVVSIEKSLESLLFEVAMHKDEEAGSQSMEEGPINGFLDEETSDSFSATDGQEIDEKKSGDTNTPSRSEKDTPTPQNDTLLTKTPGSPQAGSAKKVKFSKKQQAAFQKILATFTRIEGVHSACLIRKDGEMVASLVRKDLDAMVLGQIASTVFSSIQLMGTKLSHGKIAMTMTEYQRGPVIIAPAGPETFLVIAANEETNLGWIRLAIKNNEKIIQEVIAAPA